MTTAAVTPLIAITTVTNVLCVFVFGLIHLLEILDVLVAFCVFVFGLIHLLEILDVLVAFCATAVETIVTELGVTQLETLWRSCPKCNKQKLFLVKDISKYLKALITFALLGFYRDLRN